jgi:hypothetical protein
VWLFLASGNSDEDTKAYIALTNALALAEQELALPEGVVEASGDITGGDEVPALGPGGMIDPINQLGSAIPLKIDFDTDRVTHGQPEEPVLLASLLHLEPDLLELKDKPMVFAVFGRGRAIEPLVGAGINEQNIMDMSFYLCGPCSCQIKSMNPGKDLLVACDWEGALSGETLIEEKELPPLSGTADLTDTPPEDAPTGIVEIAAAASLPETETQTPPTPSLKRRTVAVVAGAIVAVIVGSLVLRRKSG